MGRWEVECGWAAWGIARSCRTSNVDSIEMLSLAIAELSDHAIGDVNAWFARVKGSCASLDDWVAYIVRTKSKKFILADHVSERKVKTLLSRLKTMSKKEVEQLAKG